MKVPAATISLHSHSFSCSLPSTQWMESGVVSAAIFSTQRMRCLFLVIGRAWVAVVVLINNCQSFQRNRACGIGLRGPVDARNSHLFFSTLSVCFGAPGSM